MKNWVEISGPRLVENFRATRMAAGAEVETLAVIKANGYGHGATICAPVDSIWAIFLSSSFRDISGWVIL